MRRWSQVVLLAFTMWGGSGIDVSQTRELRMQQGTMPVYSVRSFPDGKRFISASYDGTLVIWEICSGKKIWQMDLDAESKSNKGRTISHIQGMDLSPDGSVVAISYYRSHVVRDTLSANREFHIALLDSRTGQAFRILTGHTAPVGQLAFSPNNELLISEAADSTARLWKVKTGQEVLQIKLKEKGASVAFSPDGAVLAVATQPVWGLPRQDIVELYGSRTGQIVRGFPRTKNAVASLAFSPDGQVIAIASGDAGGAQLDLWRLTGEGPLLTVPMPHRKIKIVRFSPNGQWLALGGFARNQGLVEIHATSANGAPRMFVVQGEVTALDFTPNGNQVVLGTDEGQILVLPI